MRNVTPVWLCLSVLRIRKVAPMSFSWNVALALIAASFLAGSDPLTLGKLIVLSVLSMFAIALSVYLYNDLTDVEIDRLNKLDRPLVSGEISAKDAKYLVAVLGIAGLAIGFMIKFEVFLLQLTFLVLGFLYSCPFVHLKSKFLLKDLTIGVGTAITYLVGGTVFGRIPIPIFYLAAYGFVAAISTSTLKDLSDLEGDKIHKIKTLPVVWGPVLTIRLSIAMVFSIAVATIVGYSRLGFNIAFAVLASCAFVAWIYVLYPLFHRWKDPSYVYDTIVKKIAPIGFSLQIFTVLGVLF